MSKKRPLQNLRFKWWEHVTPWSVINYFSNECEPRAFWVSTGSNDIIGEILGEADAEMYIRLTALLNGESFITYIDTGVIYPQIKNNPSTIYSFLLITGYLKAVSTTLSFNGDFMCQVALPNQEIAVVYQCHLLKKVIRKSIFNNSMNLVYLRIHLKSWGFFLAKLVFHDNHFSYFNKNIRKYMFMGNLNKSKQKFIFCFPFIYKRSILIMSSYRYR